MLAHRFGGWLLGRSYQELAILNDIVSARMRPTQISKYHIDKYIHLGWYDIQENFMNWNYARMKCTFWSLKLGKCSHIYGTLTFLEWSGWKEEEYYNTHCFCLMLDISLKSESIKDIDPISTELLLRWVSILHIKYWTFQLSNDFTKWNATSQKLNLK